MNLLEIFSTLFSLEIFIVIILGTCIGLVAGSIPGVTGTMVVGALIPFTFTMEATVALILMGAIYGAAITGGSIPAIVFGAPGTPSSIATTFDGWKMTQQGKAAEALGLCISSSFIGGVIGVISLLLFAPLLSRVALMFGSGEFFLMGLWGMTLIAALSAESILKGLISGVFGLILSLIGMDPIVGFERLTFGILELYDGLPLVPTLVGLLCVSQILMLSRKTQTINQPMMLTDDVTVSFKKLKNYRKTIIRSGLLGTLIGLIPGAGANIASFFSYSEARRSSDNPENFGQGEPEGVVASETANNAVKGGSLIPMLTLGIPGSPMTAILLGALMIQGIMPGPKMFTEYAGLTYTFIFGLMLSLVAMLFIGTFFAKHIIKIVTFPTNLIVPAIMCLSIVGTYSINGRLFDVMVLIIFGIIGYGVSVHGFSKASLVLGFVLGDIIETGYFRSIILSKGGMPIFLTRPLSWVILTFVVISLWASIRSLRQSRVITSQTGRSKKGVDGLSG